jgi:putative ABC transport system permease protein
VLGFALLLSVATAVVFGLAPALRAARIDPGAALAEGRTGLAPAAARARRVLVAGEVALSLALLCVAGLLLQGFARLQGYATRFDPARALTFRVQLPPQRYADRGSVVRFQQALREGLRALPGVLEAGSTQILPLGTSLSTIDFTVEGRPPPSSENVPQAHYRLLSPATLAALGIPLIEGRDLGPSDGSEAPPVAVVNRRLAERHGVGVGTRLLLDDLGAKPRPVTIVGIAADVREAGLDRDPLVMIYVPLAQAPESALIYGRNMFWIARTAGDPLASTTAAIGAVRAIDASLPVASVQSLEQVVAVSLAPRRFNLLLVAVFASAALLLSALGIYALASQLAAARRRELGIRLALGATPASLLRFALLDGMRPVLAGLALGAVASLVVSRLAGDLLGDLPPAPMVAAAAAALVAAALTAVWFPARRAARTDAAVVMRE